MLVSNTYSRIFFYRILVFQCFILGMATCAKATEKWSQKTGMGGTARIGAVGFSIGNKGYIGTGFDANSAQYQKDFWEYDPVADTWTQKADFGGSARYIAVGFNIGDKGYIGTGFDGMSGYRKDLWEYEPAQNRWTRKADCLGSGRYSAVGFSIGKKGYIGTGFNGSSDYLHDLWEYDPSTDNWVKKADFTGEARYDAVGFSIGNNGYIGTGYTKSGMKKDFWKYDVLKDTWTRMADFGGSERCQAIGFGINGKGYIGTGFDGHLQGDFWEYDTLTNHWTQKSQFTTTGRKNAASFSMGSKGYICSGFDAASGFTRDLWEYLTEDPVASPVSVETIQTAIKNITVQLSNSGSITVQESDILNGTYGELGITNISLDKKSFDCSNMGENIVSVSVTDTGEHVLTGKVTITVMDTVAPVPVLPTLPLIKSACEIRLRIVRPRWWNGWWNKDAPLIEGDYYIQAPLALDNCKGIIIGTTTDALQYTKQGIYTIHWKFVDNSGNSTFQNQMIVIKDELAPQIIIPEKAEILANVYPDPSVTGWAKATDNCSYPALTYSDRFAGDSIIRTWMATDAAGNASSADQFIIVKTNRRTENGKIALPKEDWKVLTMPNPSTNVFTIKIEAPENQNISIQVMDIYGRIVEKASALKNNSTLKLGINYPKGIYFLNLSQGTSTKVIRLIKL